MSDPSFIPTRVARSLKKPASFVLFNKMGVRLKAPMFLLVALPRRGEADVMRGPRDRVCGNMSDGRDSASNLSKGFALDSSVLTMQELNASEAQGLTSFFFAIKATKKVGSSVIRNKIKRRIRHIIRLLVRDNLINACWLGLIVIPYKGMDRANFNDLYQSFVRLLSSPMRQSRARTRKK